MKIMNVCKIVFASMLAIGLAGPLSAQGRPGSGRGVPRYDPSTEVTVKGTVEEVSQKTGPMGWGGTHLTLKTDSETLDVHLGPSSFLSKNQFEFAKGDQVEITGSKIEYQGSAALLARELKKDGKTLTLRNAQGIPEWAGSRRRS